MVKIIIDTDYLLSYLLGDKMIVEKVKQYISNEKLYITPFILQNIGLVVEDKDIFYKINNLFRVLPFDEHATLKSIEIYFNLLNDYKENEIQLSIVNNAAIAITNKAFFLTSNKFYNAIPELKII